MRGAGGVEHCSGVRVVVVPRAADRPSMIRLDRLVVAAPATMMMGMVINVAGTVDTVDFVRRESRGLVVAVSTSPGTGGR
jgi:hypothetical protein